MSADSHTVCPKCHPEILECVGILDNIAHEKRFEDVLDMGSVRENVEYYTVNQQIGVGPDAPLSPQLVFKYRADCWTCGWHFDVVTYSPLTGL